MFVLTLALTVAQIFKFALRLFVVVIFGLGVGRCVDLLDANKIPLLLLFYLIMLKGILRTVNLAVVQ